MPRRPTPHRLNPRALQEHALRTFLEVAQSGSVSLAAARLDVAPSAVSRTIARLEHDLDTLLFERSARGMRLNSAGELLAAHARRAWLDIERVADDILALRGLRRGQVRIAATEGYGYAFLPTVAAAFQARCPGILVTLQVCAQSEVARRVRDGEVDVGVTVSLASEEGLAVALRHPAPVLAVLSERHPLAARRQLSLAQVVMHPLALPAPTTTLRRLLEISCSRQSLPLTSVFTADHLYPLLHYVAASDAITFCGELALRQHLGRTGIQAIPLRDREMSERDFEVLTLAGRPPSDALRAFIDHLREHLA